MAILDLYNKIGVVVGLNPAVYKTNQVAASIDRTAFEGGSDALVAVLTVGTWTDGTHTWKLQDSPDNATWTDVAPVFLQGSFTPIAGTGQQNATQKVGYTGLQRYVQTVDTVTGAPATGAMYGLAWIVGSAHYLPTAHEWRNEITSEGNRKGKDSNLSIFHKLNILKRLIVIMSI